MTMMKESFKKITDMRQELIRFYSRAALALLMMLLTATTAWAQDAIGSIQYNSTGSYYEIGSTDNLDDLAVYVNGTGTYSIGGDETTAHDCSGLTFKMTANITYTHDTDWNDASSEENNYTAIGRYGDVDTDHDFNGHFDGQGHTVSGIRIYKSGNDLSSDSYQGLFGLIGSSAVIRGITLADARITGFEKVGGIVGVNQGTVSDSHVAANVAIYAVQSSTSYHGGIAGQNVGTVSDCTSAATLTKPNILGNGAYYGGIVGQNAHIGTLRHNLAIGAVVPAAQSRVTPGIVIENKTYGAICGENDGGTLENNYYYACTVADVEDATGVGCGGISNGNGSITADVTDNDGAVNASPDNIELNNDGSYTIKSALGWDVFCGLLATEAKGYFTGKTVKLDANIEVSRMAGSDGYEFTGTFDGQGNTLTVSYGSSDSPITEEYAAPFRYVDGGTIENLRVCGTIYTSAKYAGGFIGIAQGSASIVNSVSGVTINSSIVGDGTHGGFVGLQGDNEGNTLGIEGCVFNGKLLGSSTNSCGGFVGWRKKTVNILNSLYAPAAATGSETWIDTGSCATFSRNDANFTNCYYTQTLGTAQGKQRRSIAAGENVTVAHAGVATTYDVSGITAYKASAESSSFIAGLLYNNVLYAGWRDAVSLTLANTPPTGYSSTYTTSPDGATLTRDGDNYTLTMPDADVTIGATFMELVSVSYIDTDGKEQTVNAFLLQGGGATTIPAGWYVVNSDVTYTGTVTLGGDVNIILADGMTMTVNTNDEYGIKGTSNALTIYGQTLGTGTLNTNRTIYCAFNMIGGTVNATSNPYAILGNVTVSGGTLNATGQYAIYGDVTVTGGTLTATSTEGDAPVNATAGLRRSDWPSYYKIFAITGNLALSGPATVTLNGYVYDGVTIADGLTFTTDGTDSYSGTLSFEKQMAIQGKTLRLAALTLADDASNTTAIGKLNGVEDIDITLSGRTLTKNGDWNTLCLPFNVVDGDNTDELTFTGTPLEGATVKELLTTSNLANDGTLTLNFSDNLTAIEAGKPYIVKWEGTSGSVSDPVFSGVTVTSTTPIAVTSNDGKVKFVGQYSPFEITAGNIDNIIMLSTGNKLGYSQNPRWLRSFRAHFEIPTNGGAPAMNSFVLNFDDELTGISLTPDPSPRGEGSEYYTLDGRKLSGKPTTKGLYIHNGKKVVLH